MDLTSDDKQFLLKVVRDTLFAKLTENEIPVYYNKLKNLYEDKIGVFIKMMNKDNVRAYGGILMPEQNLITTIQRITIQSCFHDARFSPVTNEEFENINIHLALIDAIEEINDKKFIKPQIHGLLIQFKGKKGILLPWDMRELSLSIEEYIAEAALKSGITDVNNVHLKLIRLTAFNEKEFQLTSQIL